MRKSKKIKVKKLKKKKICEGLKWIALDPNPYKHNYSNAGFNPSVNWCWLRSDSNEASTSFMNMVWTRR